ncbi:MAG: NUDIX hydrolase, partial [Acidimicrobiia bacterium]|nr:NUDIX hydrolase [Acidimicrobiia bacterium]
VLRELKEETGLIAGELTALGTIHTSNCFTDETAYLFLAEDLITGPASPDPTEKLAVRQMSFSDVMAMVERGDIQDAMTIVALYRTRDVLRGRGLIT